jgi:PAS domain S-box-containing protein
MSNSSSLPASSSRRENALQAENAALRHALAQYSNAVPVDNRWPIWQVSLDLLGVADIDGTWLEVNPAWTNVLGWPAERILGRTSDWMIHPEDLARREVRAVRALQAGTSEQFEYRCRTSDGAYCVISWTAVSAHGRSYCVGRDVTDEREHEAALRDSLDFARLALSAVSGVGVWTYEAASDRFFCDAGISELYGIDPDEGAAGIPRTGFLANVHPDDLAPLRAVMARGLLRSGDLELEYRICHPDGSTRWVLSRGHTYFNDAGVPQRRIGVGIDMTRQRKLEQQLRQSQKMEAVGQLTGGIAHDFNNMLQGVTGPLDMLRLRYGPNADPALMRYIDMALASARRAATLTHRLLAFSRRQPLAPSAVDVNALVHGLEELIKRTIGETIKLAVESDAPGCPTRCDANQLDNAILNLAINARDAMPEGGTLTIRTSLVDVDAHQAAQHGAPPGGFVRIDVSDTGVGMSAGVAGQAFEPFFTTKPIGQGTGLGLSMVYGFAGQSGGFATVDSRIGHGTTVSIHLPAIADVVAATAPQRVAPVMEHGAGGTILVVEDEPAVLAMLGEVFEQAGYTVIIAADGIAAQAMIETEGRIDLLITDVGLPGMNGRQLAEAARRKVPRLPILFMTGYAELATADGFMEPGMEMIAKPFSVEVMLGRARQLLTRNAEQATRDSMP